MLPICDEDGVCSNPCAEGLNNTWNCHGYTFSTLDEKLSKRIDFIFVRGDLDFHSLEVVGKSSTLHSNKKTMPSDHFGLFAKFKPVSHEDSNTND
jgi:endonuclease/exonuclease/phosphatase family metal-dependent hydrolase